MTYLEYLSDGLSDLLEEHNIVFTDKQLDAVASGLDDALSVYGESTGEQQVDYVKPVTSKSAIEKSINILLGNSIDKHKVALAKSFPTVSSMAAYYDGMSRAYSESIDAVRAL